MKIRTDFVTNSSSSSFVSLHITSAKLAQIFAVANEETEIEGLEILEGGKGIKFRVDELEIAPPKSINETINKLVELVTWAENFSNARRELEAKLKQDEKVILSDIEAVEFDFGEEGWGEAFGYEGFEDVYDKLQEEVGAEPESIRICHYHLGFTKEGVNETYEKKYTYILAGEKNEKTIDMESDEDRTHDDEETETDSEWSCYTQISANDSEGYDDESMSFPGEPSIMPYDLERLPDNYIDVLKAADSIEGLMDALKSLFVPGCAEWGFLADWFAEIENISALRNIKMQSVKYDNSGKGQEITLKYSFKTKKGSINQKTVKADM